MAEWQWLFRVLIELGRPKKLGRRSSLETLGPPYQSTKKGEHVEMRYPHNTPIRHYGVIRQTERLEEDGMRRERRP